MEWLRDKVEETVNLTLREGDQVVYVERATPKRMMRVEQVIGSHAPLHVTAVGKLMLGAAGREAVRDYAARTGLPAYTPHTFTARAGSGPRLQEACAKAMPWTTRKRRSASAASGCCCAMAPATCWRASPSRRPSSAGEKPGSP